MWRNIPLTVYENLIKMTKYRNITLSDPVMSDSEFMQTLNHSGYVLINGTRDSTDIRGESILSILLIGPNSDYANKTASFKDLIKILPKTEKKLDVIVVSENDITVHIKKYIFQLMKEMPIDINSYDYEIFMIEVPKHNGTVKHTIQDPEETKLFGETYNVDKTNYPAIYPSDPYAIWLGLKSGMVVELERLSETSGKSIAYRYCK